jgi:hypothetical protein
MKPRQPVVIKANRGSRPTRKTHGLLSVRSALVLALAALTAIGGAALLFASHEPTAVVALGGFASFAGAVKLFDYLIE